MLETDKFNDLAI